MFELLTDQECLAKKKKKAESYRRIGDRYLYSCDDVIGKEIEILRH